MSEESPKIKRPRQLSTDKGNKPIKDPLEYSANLSGPTTRQIIDNNIPFVFEIWFDKHLNDRQTEREGIGDEEVLKLIAESLPHMLFYALNVSSFSALTMDKRVCVKTNPSDGSEPLNVIYQAHLKDFQKNIYEITVITAMCVNDFKVKDNQFLIEMQNESYSVLKRFNRGVFNEICTT